MTSAVTQPGSGKAGLAGPVIPGPPWGPAWASRRPLRGEGSPRYCGCWLKARQPPGALSPARSSAYPRPDPGQVLCPRPRLKRKEQWWAAVLVLGKHCRVRGGGSCKAPPPDRPKPATTLPQLCTPELLGVCFPVCKGLWQRLTSGLKTETLHQSSVSQPQLLHPQGTLGSIWGLPDCHTGGCPGVQWAEARDAAK